MVDLHPKYNYYGRKVGTKLSKKAQDLLEDLLPIYKLDQSEDSFKENLKVILNSFPKAVMEIGFGKGSHLSHKILENKDTIFFGVEVFCNGVASLLQKIEGGGAKNLKIFNTNVFYVIDEFIPYSLDEIYLLFPDPWPKIRHNKRRIISEENLAKFAKLLKPNGKLKFATDHKEYGSYALEVFKKQNLFSLASDNFEKQWENHHPTEYQLKAQSRGEKSLFFELIKI